MEFTRFARASRKMYVMVVFGLLALGSFVDGKFRHLQQEGVTHSLARLVLLGPRPLR